MHESDKYSRTTDVSSFEGVWEIRSFGEDRKKNNKI